MESSWEANHLPEDMPSIQCTMSQAPLSLVEFKTWPASTNIHGDTSEQSNFCGLMPVPSFAMRFFKDFQRFCPLLPDLVLQLDSGERINVHRVLFYCCSAYCRSRLKAQQSPSEKDCWSSSRSLLNQPPKLNDYTCPPEVSIIRVPRVEYDSLRTIVDFVYSGGLLDRINIESLPKIRFAATLLGIDELVTVCDSLFRVYQQGQQRSTGIHNLESPIYASDLSNFCTPRSESPSSSPISRSKNTTPCKSKQKHQRLPSVASVLAEMSNDNRLRLINSETTSPVSVKQEEQTIRIENCSDCSGVDRKRSADGEVMSKPCNRIMRVIEYNKEDLVMSEKYIYSSRLHDFHSLLSTYNVLQCIESNNLSVSERELHTLSSAIQQKHRQSLILFSLSSDDDMLMSANETGSDESPKIHFISNSSGVVNATGKGGTQRFALLCHLDFSDKNSLYLCVHQILNNFVKGMLPLKKCEVSLELTLDAVYCLKKSSGFKSSFRRELLHSTSECYKALAEYSRPEIGELPLVLLSCNGLFQLEQK